MHNVLRTIPNDDSSPYDVIIIESTNDIFDEINAGKLYAMILSPGEAKMKNIYLISHMHGISFGNSFIATQLSGDIKIQNHVFSNVDIESAHRIGNLFRIENRMELIRLIEASL